MRVGFHLFTLIKRPGALVSGSAPLVTTVSPCPAAIDIRELGSRRRVSFIPNGRG